jgi:hypothetical protein
MFAEIYDNLCEELSDQREQNPGLSEAEFLNQFKEHPMKYATDLAAGESAYLVGPQLYFSFLSALKVALSLVVVFHVIIGSVGAFASGHVWSSFWGAVSTIPQTLLWVGAAVLGVFVAMEKSGERATWLDKWDASELQAVDSHQSVSRGEISFDLVFSSFALLWILGIVQFPAMIRHDGEWISEWSVNLPDWLWLTAGFLLAIDIAFALYRLTRSLWTRRMRLVTVITQVLWIGLLVFALDQSGLVSTDHESAVQFLPVVEKATRAILLIVCAIIAWDTLSHTWRLIQAARDRDLH